MIRLFFFAVLSVMTFSCTRMVYVPVESVKTEYRSENRTDSVMIHDSVYHLIFIKGDTVFDEKVRYEYRYINRIKSDTVLRVDSIRVPYHVEVVKAVRKKDWLYYAGNTCIVTVILFVCYLFLKLKLKLF